MARPGYADDIESCAALADDEVFDQLAEAVGRKRSADPVPDTPFSVGLATENEDGTLTWPLYAFSDTVVMSAEASDGRWLAFNPLYKVRDTDGRLYDLAPDAWREVQNIILRAMINSGDCSDSEDRFRRWLEDI